MAEGSDNPSTSRLPELTRFTSDEIIKYKHILLSIRGINVATETDDALAEQFLRIFQSCFSVQCTRAIMFLIEDYVMHRAKPTEGVPILVSVLTSIIGESQELVVSLNHFMPENFQIPVPALSQQVLPREEPKRTRTMLVPQRSLVFRYDEQGLPLDRHGKKIWTDWNPNDLLTDTESPYDGSSLDSPLSSENNPNVQAEELEEGEVVAEELEEGEVVVQPVKLEEGEVVAQPKELQEREVVAQPAELEEGEVVPQPEELEEGEVVPQPAKPEEGEVVAQPAELEEGEVVPQPEELEEGEVVPQPEELEEGEVVVKKKKKLEKDEDQPKRVKKFHEEKKKK